MRNHNGYLGYETVDEAIAFELHFFDDQWHPTVFLGHLQLHRRNHLLIQTVLKLFNFVIFLIGIQPKVHCIADETVGNALEKHRLVID